MGQTQAHHGGGCACGACYDYDESVSDCFQCGGEGYVYGCSWDWQCDTYDEGEGTCLCTRRCDVCNPAKLSAEQEAERDALRKVLADALTRTATAKDDR